MSNDIEDKLKGTPEERWLKNANKILKSGFFDELGKLISKTIGTSDEVIKKGKE